MPTGPKTALSRTVNEHFDRFAEEYNASAEWCSDEVLTENLVATMDGQLVLDLGCGTGLLLDAIRDKQGRGCGIDLSFSMLREASKHTHGRLVQGAAENTPFASNTFDVVVCRQLLHYTREAEVLCEVARILKPGGEFRLAQITSLDTADFEFWSIFKALLQPLRRRYYTPNFLISLAQLSGFEVINVERHLIRRHYPMSEIFRRAPLNEEGRRRTLEWIRTETTKLSDRLDAVIDEHELAINQYWVLMICRPIL